MRMADRPSILGALLVRSAGLDPQLLERALHVDRRPGERIGQTLVRVGAVTEEQVARALASQLGLGYRAGPLDPDPVAVATVSPSLCAALRVVPLALAPRRITVALRDPLDARAIDDLQFQTGRHVDPVVTTEAAIDAWLARKRPHGPDNRDTPDAPDHSDDPVDPKALDGRPVDPSLPGDERDGVRGGRGRVASASGPIEDFDTLVAALPADLTRTSTSDDDVPDAERDARRAPVVRLVDRILREAVERGASDIHIEETGSGIRVRARIDGVLRPTVHLPAGVRRAVLSRIKVISGMDISVRRRAQDGRTTLVHEGRTLTLRVSTLPVNGGEKAVVRILDAAAAPRDLAALGMATRDLQLLRTLLARSEGVILAAGPTGSGKSTTLFAALSEIDRERRNVVTVEDPVEYRLSGASQVHVDRKAGLGFADALRAILRQDPDVVMVGEIRDRETAEIAMAAAVTGHLVLSTIHTTDAPGAVTRLLHMGVPPFLVAGGLSGVIAQRLVRSVCATCRGHGCEECVDGCAGRTGVYQLLAVTDPMRDEITREGSASRLRRLAMDGGMTSLASDARRAVAEGLTAPHEVGRLLASAAELGRPCPSCAHVAPHGARGCPACGRRLLAECGCGARLESGWRYCPACIRPITRT